MAYGGLRIWNENLITSVSDLTLSSQAAGWISAVKKTGSGVASLTVYGPFEGAFDMSYEVECDLAGELGVATIKWRTSDTADGAWEQTGVLTATTPRIALSSDGLGTNIELSFAGASGSDFVLGDSWTWNVKATYGGERILDRDRNTEWRSTGITSENIVIDYGAAQQVTGVLLHDHNLTDAATVHFQANATDSWGAPSVDYTFSTITDPLSYYLDQTYRYNRWTFTDATNTDDYIRVGNIMHSLYETLEKVNFEWGSQQIPGARIQENESLPGVLRRYFHANRNDLSLNGGEVFSNNDVDTLIDIADSLKNSTTKRVLPMWVHLFYDEPDTLKLYNWQNIAEWARTYRSYLLNSGITLLLNEVVKV